MGNPINSVAWLANKLHEYGVTAEAGHVISGDNLLNLQKATEVDNTYTRADVLPSNGNLTAVKTSDGGILGTNDVNPNFGRVMQYQDPRIFRFGLRFNY